MGSSQTVRPEPVRTTFSIPAPTIWLSYSFAPEWFQDALQEARVGRDHHARRREIIFAVCAAESYLLEWVRDEVLQRDFQALDRYFPPGKKRPVQEKWKDIPKQLYGDKRLAKPPSLGEVYWQEWLKLVGYRNGLVHAQSSRPETAQQSNQANPVPFKTTLDQLQAGWAVSVVVNLVRHLHDAIGTPPPSWLEEP